MNQRFFSIFTRTAAIICGASVAFFIAYSAFTFFGLSFETVNGRSMEPTLIDGDTLVVSRISYLLQPPKRREIAQFINPRTKRLLVKRIIGLPGEIIEIKEGRVWITNNERDTPMKLDEPYVLNDEPTYTLAKYEYAKVKLNANEYFLLGDNRLMSTDSREYGPVPRSLLLGRIVKTFK